MSTRAIVRVQGVDSARNQDTWNLACHHDGDWSYLGAIIGQVAQLACQMVTSFADEVALRLNSSIMTDKFIVYLIQQLGMITYIGAYMTTRDPEEELTSDSTDIEFLYIVSIHGDGVITIQPHKRNIETKTYEVFTPDDREIQEGKDNIARFFQNNRPVGGDYLSPLKFTNQEQRE